MRDGKYHVEPSRRVARYDLSILRVCDALIPTVTCFGTGI